MEEILIKKHEKYSPIKYPTKCLPVELYSIGNNRDNSNDLIEWSEVEEFREGECGVTHVEVLEIPERYVRGIVTHKGQEYVFSARAGLMDTVSKIDMTALIEDVIKEIKGGCVG